MWSDVFWRGSVIKARWGEEQSREPICANRSLS